MENIFDKVVEYSGRFEVEEFRIGRTNSEPSYLRLKVEAPEEASMERLLQALHEFGCATVDGGDAVLREVERDRCAPEDFYSTTNHRTFVRHAGKWIEAENQRMDAMIVVAEGRAFCRRLRDLRAGDRIVTGLRGIRVAPESKERDRLAFAFMSNGISSERQVETAVRQTAALVRQAIDQRPESDRRRRPRGGSHGRASLACHRSSARGFVHAVLAGNALGVHDIEASLFGTSLGVRLSDGRQEEHGHRNHMRAINAIYHAGSVQQAVESGRLPSGVLYECVKANVPFVLAGSLRDDGPLPDTITDMNAAQDAYAEHFKGAGLVLLPRLDAALHRHRQHAAELGQNRVRRYQPRRRHQSQRPRHRTGRRRRHRRRPVPRSLIQGSRMKRAYTDEHAAAGVHAPLPEIETWPNQFAGYEIEIAMPEFTSVCPKTGLPDFGKIVLRYLPDKLCLELKSYKMYLLEYRNLGIFQENAVNRILKDVVKAAKPIEATVIGDWAPRGGLSTLITASWSRKRRARLMESAELIAMLQAVRERVRASHPETHAGASPVPLPDLMPLIHARDSALGKVAAIGTVNPRRGGPLNALVQSWKRLVARVLDWHVRDQVEFNRKTIACLDAAIEALSENNRALVEIGNRAAGARSAADGVRDLLDHWVEWRADWERKLAQTEIQFLRSVAEQQGAAQHRVS